MLGGVLSLATANEGGKVAWVVPTYKNGRTLWRWAENATAEARQAGIVSANKTERTMEFSNGGLFGVYSADSEDSIRGESFHLVILDEAARIPESAWTDAIQPTLADFSGDAILISTPKGLNWFHDEWVRGQNMMNLEYAAWTAPSADNPNPRIQNAARLAKERIPDLSYRQEWLAEFVSGGAYFQNIAEAAIVKQKDIPENHQGHALYMAMDWGKSGDWSVFGVACRECNRVVDWERFNQIDYIYQRERAGSMFRRWKPSWVLPERNSMGEPNIEMLVNDGWPVMDGHDDKPGFYTGPTTKPPLIEGLAQAFIVHGFKVPKEAYNELAVYEVNIMPSGHSQFSAPDTQHDDWVMMLALLWRAMTSNAWVMVGRGY